MSASLDSTSTEDNVPVLKPKDLSLVPSPLFLRTPTNKSSEPELDSEDEDFDLEMNYQFVEKKPAKKATNSIIINYYSD